MKKYVFSVSGMSCAMCESHINDMVRRTCEIKSVKSDRKKNEMVVIADSFDIEAIKKTLSESGYKAELKEESEYDKRTLFRRLRGQKK